MRTRDFYPRHPDERGLQCIDPDYSDVLVKVGDPLDLGMGEDLLLSDEEYAELVHMEMAEVPREPTDADREEYFRQMQQEYAERDKVRREIAYDAWMRRKKRDA